MARPRRLRVDAYGVPLDCPSCGAVVGDMPYDWSGRPKLMCCFTCEPVVFFCETCSDRHVCVVKDEVG